MKILTLFYIDDALANIRSFLLALDLVSAHEVLIPDRKRYGKGRTMYEKTLSRL